MTLAGVSNTDYHSSFYIKKQNSSGKCAKRNLAACLHTEAFGDSTVILTRKGIPPAPLLKFTLPVQIPARNTTTLNQ
jgi:hypothetical protein